MRRGACDSRGPRRRGHGSFVGRPVFGIRRLAVVTLGWAVRKCLRRGQIEVGQTPIKISIKFSIFESFCHYLDYFHKTNLFSYF
jgi:hypothetical protein